MSRVKYVPIQPVFDIRCGKGYNLFKFFLKNLTNFEFCVILYTIIEYSGCNVCVLLIKKILSKT